MTGFLIACILLILFVAWAVGQDIEHENDPGWRWW
jgi:hypothetical protein